MKKLLIILLYVIFLVVATEFGLRIMAHFAYKTPILDTRRYRSDPFVIWKLNPGYTGKLYFFRDARINRKGFLGPELEEPKGADLVRVVSLGGSVTFGFGVSRMRDSYCCLLDSLLNLQAGPWRYEVVNAGVIGYSSYHGRGFVEHYLESLQPDVLVVGFGWNDSLWDLAPDKNPLDRKKRRLDYTPRFWQENFMLAVVLPKIVGQVRRKLASRRPHREQESIPMVQKVDLEDFRANMEAMYRWCCQHHVKFLLLTEPAAVGSEYGTVGIGFLQPYHTIIRQMADSLQVPLADVDSCFKIDGCLQYYDDPEGDFIHCNRLGQLRMAQVVAQTLRQVGYLSK